ncbi:MAG: glycosyltransferase [Deltaproteobacteria bacterium]|nr:glycosyltransferase [Deltaproteobacteria bacterium]
MIRVLHVVGSLSPEWGGLSRAVAGLSGALARLGLEVEIITTAQGQEEQLQAEGTKVQVFRCGPLAWRRYAGNLAPAIKEVVRRADLVHIHGLWLYPHLIASRAALRACKPYILSPHGMLSPWALAHKKARKRIYGSLIECRTLRKAAALHALSGIEAIDLMHLGFSTRVFIVPNGIDVRKFASLPDGSALSIPNPIPREKTILLFLGRLHPIKGLDVLVRAFCKVVRKRENVMLVIAGPDETDYRRRLLSYLDTESAKAHCLFTGMLRGGERLAALAAADVFILPSYSEGFGVAAIEAMAAKLPTILSKACGISGVEEAGAGFVVAPETDALCGAILRLIDDPLLRERMGENGRQLVLAKYTWDKVAKRMIEAYQTILASRKA